MQNASHDFGFLTQHSTEESYVFYIFRSAKRCSLEE